MRPRWRSDEGATAVTVALLGVVFIILSALVVDMGYWYNVRRQLQASADSAALAGCRELAVDASDTEIWNLVTAFAQKNAVVPVDNMSVVAPSPGGESDIGDDFVKVTVASNAVGFFGRMLGRDTNTIRAQSKAELGYLTGVRSPVPWALPILRVTRMVAVANGVEYSMSSGSDGSWSGWLPAGSSGSVDVIAYNGQTLDPAYPNGVPEQLGPVTRLIYLPAGSRFKDVRMPKQTFTSGAGESVRVYVDLMAPLAPGESVEVTYGKQTFTAAPVGGNSYAVSFAAPSTDDLWKSSSYSVEIVDGKKAVETLPGDPVFVVRRSTYPIKSVASDPFVFRSGAAAPIRISVDLNSYTYGNTYELKVIGGGGESGNYMAIDFHTLRHTPNWRAPQDPAEYPDMPGSTNLYYDYIAGTASYDFIMHIGDTVWTEPGNMSGPTTRQALEDRFGGEASDFAGWVAAGKPLSKRLVFVPITEKVQEVTGSTPLRVVSFAVMYVESVANDSGGALVRGRFVEYAGPGWIVSSDPPDSSLVVRAAHLVADGVDF